MAPEGAFDAPEIARDRARATVRPAHVFHLCEGHFPGEPIVPGAYLAALMADLAAALMAAGGGPPELAEVERCAFLARVTPDHPVSVTVRRDGEARAHAEIHTRGSCAARATLRFGPAR